MSLTIDEMCERITNRLEVDEICELLDIGADELLDYFQYKVADKWDMLEEEFDNGL